MSTITLTPSGFQIHQDYGVGLVLQHPNYYSIAPKQKKLPIKLQIIVQQLCILSLVADFYKSEGQYKSKSQQVATKIQDNALSFLSTREISAATRHYSKGVNSTRNVVLLFPGSYRHRHLWVLYCLILESYGSGAPSVGYKRASSPGSGNQSAGKKQRSDQQKNNRNDRKGNKGNGQGQGKKKRDFGPQHSFIKKLACLFFKLDPREYQSCAGYDLTKWDHVLQHLKRKHIIRRDHCPKCRKEFEGEFAETEWAEHIRQDTCAEKTALDTGLLLQSEYDDLAGLHGTHEEKWFKAWKKLFGDQQAPCSPFFETVDCMLEAQQSTMRRELPIILQSFRRDALARPEGDTISATIDAILRLLRNPIPVSNSLARSEPQAVLLAPSTVAQVSRVQDTPPSHDTEPWSRTREVLRPSTGNSYELLDIPTMEARPFATQEMLSEVVWPPPLEEPGVVFDAEETFHQWMNYPDEGQYFEEFDNSGHTLE